MPKSPSFQFYPSDWMEKRVLRMSDAAQGVYMRLLCYMWNDSAEQCSIEKEDKVIAKLLGLDIRKWKKYHAEIQWSGDPILLETDTHYISVRLRKEKQGQVVRSEKARQSANSRWNANAIPEPCERDANAYPEQCISSSSSASKKITDKNNMCASGSRTPRFENFWSAWPGKKVEKKKCLDHWKLHHLEDRADEIAAGLKREIEWRRNAPSGAFVPHWKNPITWLRGECWNDVMTVADYGTPKKDGHGHDRGRYTDAEWGRTAVK